MIVTFNPSDVIARHFLDFWSQFCWFQQLQLKVKLKNKY